MIARPDTHPKSKVRTHDSVRSAIMRRTRIFSFGVPAPFFAIFGINRDTFYRTIPSNPWPERPERRSDLRIRKAIGMGVAGLMVGAMLGSCAVTEALTVGGTSETKVVCDGWFLDVMGDMASFGDGDGKTVMDETMGAVGGTVRDMEGIGDVRLYGAADGTEYRLVVDVDNLGAVAKEVGGDLVEYKPGKMKFRLDMDTYEAIEKLVPALSTPELEVYGPRYSNGMSEEEYLDMMTFLLDEGAAEKIRASRVELNIRVPGKITKAVGLTKKSDDTAVLEMDLLDILLLNDPVEFELRWK